MATSFDAVAELLGVTQIGGFETVDATAGNIAPVDAGAEGQVSEDGQFLRGFGAIDVERGVGFCITEPLRFFDGGVVVGPLLFHLREDEIAGAVQDAAERLNLVGREALADVGDDRNAAGDRRFERDAHIECAGAIEQLGAVLGEQSFVGGDDIFAVGE